jgi:signal transduction histidine kinase
VFACYVAAASGMTALVGHEPGFGGSLLATGVAALIGLPLRDGLQRAVNRLMYGERDEPWRAMRRLGQRLEWAAEPDRAFPAIVDTVAEALRSPYVALEVRAADGSPAIVAERGAPSANPVIVPLLHGAEPVGRLLLGVRAGERGFRDDERRLLEDLARQAGTAVSALRLREDLTRSREALVVAREEERRRLRRDLHDGLGPSLAAIGMHAEASAGRVRTDPAGAEQQLRELGDEIGLVLAEIRRVVDGLRPPALDELGLVGAIRQQAERLERGGSDGASPRIDVVEGGGPLDGLPAAVEVAAYRIAVEALTNAVRHADAETCCVRIEADGALLVEIVDDGRGIDADARSGIGLESMRNRTAELGGELVVEPSAGRGTRVVARLPIAPGESR